jgi:aspartate/methionine/tyrosine aminotransferase
LNRYSERLPWSTPRNAFSVLLERTRQAGEGLLDLTISNPTKALPDYPHGEMARVYGDIGDFQYQAEALGGLSARRSIADWYARQGIIVPPERIALCASTSEAYSLLFKLLCNPGDEVLIPSPSYPLFDYLAQAEGVKTAPYRLVYDGGWSMDLESVREAISARTKAIVLVNPNNPTGSFLKTREWRALVQIATLRELTFISDEVFMTYPAAPADDPVRSLIGRDEVLSFSLNGLSKAAGMPQMKLGWMVVNGPEEEVLPALGKLELLLDTYLSVSTPVERALPRLFALGEGIHAQIAARLRQNREALGVFRESPIGALASEGGWSAILRVPAVRSEEAWMTRLLTEYNVVVQPGYFYDMAAEAYLVVSLLASPDNFAEGLDRLRLLADG